MKIALAQVDTLWEEREANLGKAERLAARAADTGCELIVFPEMFTTGFSMNVPAVCDDEEGETAAALSACAKRYGITIIGGFPARSVEDGKGLNLAVAYGRSGARIARYAKLHLFPLAREDRHYLAGDEVVVFETGGMPASLFICYDLRFPEAFRKVAGRVHAVFVIANWPLARLDHWETLLKARAIENQCFVIGVNRVGRDGYGVDYPGRSRVIDPSGNVAAEAGEAEELVVCEIDPRQVAEIRTRFPFLKDMRSDF